MKHYSTFVKRKIDRNITDSDLQNNKHLLQKVLGLQEEVGELSQIFSKQMLYGHNVDIKDITSELGDVLFYVTAIGSFYNLSLDDIANFNEVKLIGRAK